MFSNILFVAIGAPVSKQVDLNVKESHSVVLFRLTVVDVTVVVMEVSVVMVTVWLVSVAVNVVCVKVVLVCVVDFKRIQSDARILLLATNSRP